MVTLSVRPVDRPASSRAAAHGLYQARLDGWLVCESRTPLLSGARVLLELGFDPETPLQMQHDGSATIAMITTVGEAARLSVRDRYGTVRFERWKPFPMAASTRSHKHA